MKSQFYLKDNFDKAININFMKSTLLNMCPFNITVCDKMRSTHKALLCCVCVFFFSEMQIKVAIPFFFFDEMPLLTGKYN